MRRLLLATSLFLPISASAGQPMIIAHRGVPGTAPENTIPAFRLAWEQGADAIEGDFHLTKDGHIVCIHDGNTKKVSTTNAVISTSTLAELRALDVGVHKGKAFAGTRIPTLAEVFSTIPEKKMIYIELKCGAEIIPLLIKEIASSGLTEEQILIISFHEKVLQELKVQAPKYRTSWLCSFKKQKTGAITPSGEAVMSTLKRINADGLSSNTDIPEPLIEAIRQQGYQWHIWTVDDPKTANRMKALGAKSITTNVPKTIKAHLAEPSPADGALKTAPKE